MLEDIRNSTLLTMISAVVMAVVTIALQPEPPSEPAAAHAGGFGHAACGGGATTPTGGTCPWGTEPRHSPPSCASPRPPRCAPATAQASRHSPCPAPSASRPTACPT